MLVWTVKEGKTVEIRFDDRLWVPKDGVVYTRATKKSYIVKWIGDSRVVGDVFSLDDFYKDFPRHKRDGSCRKRIVKAVGVLIGDGFLRQLGSDRFELLKELK